jgi:electron transfer flavoprotein beta subunit
MRGIMTARTKPLQVLDPFIALELSSSIAYELPPAKSACKIIAADKVADLVNLLHSEAKVI